MNHTYRLVWNDQTQRYVPAPETARGRGKGKHGKTALAGGITALALTLGMAATSPAYAQQAVGGAGGWSAIDSGGAGGSAGMPGESSHQGSPGGAAGTPDTPNGDNGYMGSGGGGGYEATANGDIASPMAGGQGGNGGMGTLTVGGGGGGGGGGAGVVIQEHANTAVRAYVTGGMGGMGGMAFPMGGGGGNGGAGVSMQAPGTLTTTAGVTGGAGGAGGGGQQSGQGGSGGAGVAVMGSGMRMLNVLSEVQGGNGGAGGTTATPFMTMTNGGNGGNGGAGVALMGPGALMLKVAGELKGGDGGTGGTAAPSMEKAAIGGSGGDGGAGVAMQAAGSVNVTGSVAGGTGGDGGMGNSSGMNGAPGRGGVGILGAAGGDVYIVNSGHIEGGMGNGGRADAISLFGKGNQLELWQGSTIVGNVSVSSVPADGVNKLILGGINNDAFNVSQIGDSAQYRGFNAFEKWGISTWTLTGSGNQNWSVVLGTLKGDTASIQGNVAFNNGPGNRGLVFDQAFDGSYDGTISGDGSLTKTGTGTVTLTGHNSNVGNSYTGGTTVSGGTLKIDGSGYKIDHANADLTVGNASLVIASGDVRNRDGSIGADAGSTGSATVTGTSSWWTNTGNLKVGNEGNGTLTIEDGGFVISDSGAIGHAVGSTGSVTVTGFQSNWSNNGALYVGDLGSGTLNIKNHGLVLGNPGTDSAIGAGLGSTGVVTVASGGYWRSGNLHIGLDGAGTLRIESGGGVNNQDGIIGGHTSGTGAVTVTGEVSRWENTGNLKVGNEGNGTLTIEKRGFVTSDSGAIGYAAGSTGSVTVTGSQSRWFNNGALYVGYLGSGTLSIEDNGHVGGNPGTDSVIGAGLGSTGVVTVASGGTWTSSYGRNLHIGLDGAGTLRIESGGYVQNQDGIIGGHTSGTGAVTVTGANASGDSAWRNTGNLYIGRSGNGTLRIENGGKVSNQNGTIGDQAGGTGAVTVTGSGSTWTNAGNLYVGRSGNGTLRIENGGTVINATGIIGDSNIANGSVTVTGSGSTWTNAGTLSVGNSGNGTLTIENGGTVNSVDGFIGANPSSSAVVTVASGGTWNASRLLFSNTGTLNIGAYDLSAPTTAGAVIVDYLAGIGTVNFNQTDNITFSTPITDHIHVNQRGSGTTTLTGDNFYTQGTTISGGTLQIGDGGTTGSLAGSVVNNATLAFNRGDTRTFAGAISGSGTVRQIGNGTTILTGTNAYTGGTTISNGTLQIGNGGTTGSIAGNVLNNAALAFNRSDALTFNGSITGAGAVRQIGSGTTILAGTNTYTGDTTISGGTLQIGDGGTTGSIAGNVLNDGTLAFNRSDALRFDGTISGNGTLTKTGAGTVTLTQANTYTGGTKVKGGTLEIDGGGIDHGNANLIVGESGGENAALVIRNGAVNDLIGRIADSGGSTGAVTVTGANSTWANAGNLYVGRSGNGTLRIENGGKVNSASGFISSADGSNGSVTVTGSGSTWTNAGTLYVGSSGNGALTIDNGGTVSSAQGDIGANPFSSAVVTVASGGTWTIGGRLGFGLNSGTGTLNIGAYDLTAPTTAGTVIANYLTTGGGSGTVNFNQTDDIIFSAPMQDNIAVNQRGSGTTTLTGNNIYNRGTTISGGTLQIGDGGTSGSIVGNVANNGTLAFNRSGTLTFAGSISGNGTVRQIGAGTTILTGTNTYTGGTTISNGTLQIGNGGYVSGSLMGDIVNNGTLAFNHYNEFTFAGSISGTGAVRLIHGHTVLTGSNTYTGDTTIVNGVLQFGDDTSADGANTLGGRIDVGGRGVLAIHTPTTVTVAKEVAFANGTQLHINTTTNGPSLRAERLSLGTGVLFNLDSIDDLSQLDKVVIDTASGIAGDFGTVTIGGAAGAADYITLAARKSADGKQYLATYGLSWNAGNQAHGTFTLAGANDRFTVGAALADQAASATGWDGASLTKAGAGTLILTGANTYTGGTTITGGTLQIGDGGTTGSIAGNVANGGTLAFNRSDALTFAGMISGNGTLTKNGAGTLTLTGANTYAGGTTIKGGTLEIDGGGIDHRNATLTVGESGGENAALVIRNGTVINSTGSIGQDAGSIGTVTVTGSGSTWTNAGELLVGNAGKGALTIENGGTVSSTWGFLGVDASSSAVVTVASGGTWKLVTGGSPSKLVFGAGASAGTLNIGAYDLSRPTTAGTVTADILDTGTGTGTVNFNQTDATTFSSRITGNIAVNQRGSGTTTLTGDNTYTGGTAITGGTLQIGNGGTTGSLIGDVVNNGSLAFNRSDALTFTGSISGNGTVHQVGAGTTILTGTNTYTGGTTISGGTLQIGNGGPWGLLAGNVVNNGTLAFNRDGLLVLNGAISGTGAVRQIGGTTILTGTNTYAGDTTVSAGTLQFGDTISAGGANTLGGRIDVTGGGLAIHTSATVTVAQDVAFADNTALAITATPSGPSLRADRLGLGTGVAFNLSGIDNLGQTDKAFIDTASGITGEFGTVTAGGASGTVDYLSLVTRKSGDGKQYLATYNLIWNAGNQAHGTFTLADAGERFTLGAALANQDASGAWDGKSLTKAGSGTLILTGANTYTGGTTITDGTLQIGNGGTSGSIEGDVTNNGTLAFNRSDALTFEGTISGNGAIRQTGSGRVNLTGDSSGFSGSTTVEQGTLSVNGQLGGALSVGAAGRLQGNGTVGDTVVAGTVAPGNSIGTLNVASVTFNPGSTYEVEVNAAGQSDKIVAAGAATINGGTVRVLAGAGNYAPATTYTILTANGGRTGTFDGVISNFAFLTPTLSYDANDVTLTLTRNTTAFAAIGATRNQAAVGGGVGSLGAGNVLANAVVGLSADQARAAFDLLSGEVHASAKSALIENGRHVQNAMTDRLRGAFDILGAQTAEPIKVAALGDVPVLPAAVHSGPVLWTQGYGSWGRLDGDGNAAGLKHDSQGIFIGTDSPVGDWRFGAVAGIGRTGFDTSDRRSNGHSDNYHFGLYGGARWDALSFRTGAAWTRHDLSTSRTVAIPGFTDSLKADYRARTVQVFGELGYRMQGRQAALEPFANLAHTNLRTDGFTERGGAAALRTSATTTDATFSTLGLRAATRVALGMTEARLAGTLGWRHAFGSATPESTLRFASGGNDFGIAGTPIARNSAVFEAGLDFRLASNATLGASYVGQLASGAREHGVKVGFNMEF